MPIENENLDTEVPSAPEEGVSFDDAAAEATESEGLDTPDEEFEEEAVDEKESVEKEPEESLKDQDFDSIDPNNLPPEVLKFYKGMQGSFTKKMQALQQAMESLEPHKDRLALVDRALQGDKEAQATLARISGARIPEPLEAKVDVEQFYKDVPKAFDTTRGLVEYLDKRFGGYLQQYVAGTMPQLIQQQVAPVLSPIHEMNKNVVVQKVETEISRLKAAYPDFDNHIAKMIEHKKENPHLTMEQAYKLSSYRDPVAPKKIVSKPGVRPGATKAPDKEIRTWDEAGKEALRLLKGR